ncbi:MAG: histidine phosphatase family protein [Candidatus Curtissbacteria bacterium]|nr:histidine phosphatase family protein [Candidatus Curtissbacteria bacterium]
MTKLIFITHPAVDVDPTIPINQWHVSKDGQKQIDNLLTLPFWSEVDVIYSSQEGKALNTANKIKSHFDHLKSPAPEGTFDLHEIDRSATGVLPKDVYDKAIEEFYLYPNKSYKGWETANAAKERIFKVVSQIIDDNPNKTVAIVGHGATGTLLACQIKKIEPSFAEDPHTNGCIMVYDWDEKTILSPWTKY